MNEHLRLIFAPVLPVSLIEMLAAFSLIVVLYAVVRRAHGALLRGAVFALILMALTNPSLIEELHAPLKDTALLVIDDSASMRLGDRSQQAASALDSITKTLAGFSDLDIETLHVKGNEETDFFRALEGKLSAIPHDRLAGVIAFTDGEIHDKPQDANPLSAPLHVLLAGHHNEIDRRLIVKKRRLTALSANGRR